MARSGRSPLAGLIRVASRGPYNHVGMVCSVPGEQVYVIEAVRPKIRVAPALPGDHFYRWDYCCDEARWDAVARMFALVGTPYSRLACASDGLQVLLGALGRDDVVLFDTPKAFNCSEAYAYAVGLDFRGILPQQVVARAGAQIQRSVSTQAV